MRVGWVIVFAGYWNSLKEGCGPYGVCISPHGVSSVIKQAAVMILFYLRGGVKNSD